MKAMPGPGTKRYKRLLDRVRNEKEFLGSAMDQGKQKRIPARRLNRWMGWIIKLSDKFLRAEEEREVMFELDKIRNIRSSRRDNTVYINDILIAGGKIISVIEGRIKAL